MPASALDTTGKLTLCAALLGALALSACGKVGSLDRPAPLFGRKDKAEYAAEKKREQMQARANRAGDKGGDPAPPAPDYGQGDPTLDPARAAPTPGAASNPFSNPNSGGLMQDPVANPNALPR
ncbi:MAG TPA: hypothetical protein VMU59_07205 [Caulobacteraceae bacterium]|nr:hypothetical protein [Caulobacteraceae bacterium]